MRPVAAPFVAAAPAGTRVRARLRVAAEDVAMLSAVGRQLGSLASADLAARCGEGRLDAEGRAVSRRERKRSLTAWSSSRSSIEVLGMRPTSPTLILPTGSGMQAPSSKLLP